MLLVQILRDLRSKASICVLHIYKGAVIILFIMDAVLCLDVVRAHPCIAVDIQIARSSCSCALNSEISSFSDILAPHQGRSD